MKTVVITGATRGIGFGMAREFIQRDHRVVISGRDPDVVKQAALQLSATNDTAQVLGVGCDVRDRSQVENLWEQAESTFEKVDIWINNAGIGHKLVPPWEVAAEKTRAVIETNFLGLFYGCQVAIPPMIQRGFGAIYNMEGFGSDGRTRMGLSIYGASKSATTFLSKSIATELKGTGVIMGRLQPGMVATELVTDQYLDKPEEWTRVKKVLNIFVETVSAVSPPLVEKILANKQNGAVLRAFSKSRIYLRFLSAPFSRRIVFT